MSAKYFRTNSVETRMDPDQLVCQKQANLDLYCFQDRVYVMDSAVPRVLIVVSMKIVYEDAII